MSMKIGETEGSKPVYRQPYCATHDEWQKQQSMLHRLKEAGIIRDSASLYFWCLLCFLVKKKNGKYRKAADYRQLN